MRAKADAMVEAASKQVENATAAAESRVAALSELITRIRESDAEEIRKKDEETRKKAEAMAEETRKKAEAMAEVTTKKGEAMAEKQFLEKISEPNGKPEFTSKATSPSYAETLDFINGKLSEAGWSMKYGTNSKKFIIIHSSGAYFVDFATLSAGIKYTTVGAFFKVTLEAAGARNPIQNIAMNGQAEDAVTSIDVPCKDKFDSEKLAKAFRHLILMAGGKDDPF